ncbi:MAG: sigma-54 dependent transcriptional regulator [Bacteroidota bacterium]
MKNILIIDDEFEMLQSLGKILSHITDYKINLEQDPNEALRLIEEKQFDLIISDLKMGSISGLEILESAQKQNHELPVIMISGYGTIEASVEAIQKGAFDFIEKPFTSRKLLKSVEKALSRGIDISDDNLNNAQEIHGITYSSKQMQSIINSIEKISFQNMNVLILGESGVGKELVARAIHKLSKGKQHPFVPVNCGALPEELFESELFGHERGAFTGAVKTKPGLLEFANHGTFFFDEIGDMSLPMQIKILRLLEEKKIRRVGGNKEIDIDIRIIAATNKNLEREIDEGKFRGDLFYRLNTFQITVPPIRERKDDIVLLANHFLTDLCQKGGFLIKRFSQNAEEALKEYSWPGNVRELYNVVSRAFYSCAADKKVIENDDLLTFLSTGKQKLNQHIFLQSYKNAKESVISKFEVDYLTHHLKENAGNISLTAHKCGLDRRSIHRLISKYNIIYQDES